MIHQKLSRKDRSLLAMFEHYCLVSEIEGHRYSVYGWDSHSGYWSTLIHLSAFCASAHVASRAREAEAGGIR
jgi:hypothetical protein